jgi:hypothetical protein
VKPFAKVRVSCNKSGKHSRGYDRHKSLEDRKLVRDEKMRALFRIELRQSKLGTDLAFTNKEMRKPVVKELTTSL